MLTGNVLVMTIGTGDIERPKESLFDPLMKSIGQGTWSEIVLLPSRITADNARILERLIEDVKITVCPLEQDNQENNADLCYAHFDRVITSLIHRGYAPYTIAVDFTRGTKAMSAALVLAAVRHDIPVLRYISGERDKRGMVIAGTERIEEFSTLYATARRVLDAAHRFFIRGAFSGVLELLPEDDNPFARLWPEALYATASCVRAHALFYSRWDMLDYKAAVTACTVASFPDNDIQWSRFAVTRDMRSWLRCLAAETSENSCAEKAEHVRCLAADILANGERRVRDCHYEDAIIRAYRVLELIGQARLFDYGHDSGNLDPNHADVQAMVDKLEKSRSAPFAKSREGGFTAARMQVVRFLKHLGDTLAPQLKRLGECNFIDSRNHHVLIHGFQSMAPSDVDALKDYYMKLDQLVCDDGGEQAERRLKIARSMDFSCS